MGPASYFQVDTFTDEPFRGNPAGVCLLDEPRSGAWLAAVAAETRLPATAFVVPGDTVFDLRWFTPAVELEICGHGTVAAAHVLWETRLVAREESITFATLSGPIAAVWDGGAIFLSLRRGEVVPAVVGDELGAVIDGLPAQPESVWRTPLDYLLLFERPEDVLDVAPDPALLQRVETRGLIVTAPGGRSEVDFTSRFFAPSIGVPEDSVTGSAHASLAPFWAGRLEKTRLRAHQASARGGYLELRVSADAVQVGGPAVTVLQGLLGV